MKNRKKEPWRIAVGIASITYIVYTWIRKDIVQIYATMPQEQIFPMVATTVAVSLLKIAAIAGVVLGVKWLLSRRNP